MSIQPAFLLHAWPYKESSLLVDFFTRDSGRISAIIRGAKRKKSIAARLAHPFIAVNIGWQGRGQLQTLTHIEARGMIHQLTARRLISGMYINELLIRLCKHADPHPQLFDHYEQTLQELAKPIDEQQILRGFERKLLQEIGYELPLLQNIITNEIVVADKSYYFDPMQGPYTISPNKVGHFKDATLFKGESLLALANDALTCKEHLTDAKRLMRQVLAVHLGDRPLATRKLFAHRGVGG